MLRRIAKIYGFLAIVNSRESREKDKTSRFPIFETRRRFEAENYRDLIQRVRANTDGGGGKGVDDVTRSTQPLPTFVSTAIGLIRCATAIYLRVHTRNDRSRARTQRYDYASWQAGVHVFKFKLPSLSTGQRLAVERLAADSIRTSTDSHRRFT